MGKALVAYYSWTGHTGQIAEAVAAGLSADVEQIREPVWAGRMASPLRAYVAQERHKFARIALFCTEGGANGEKALAQIGQLCGKEPAATLIVTERDIASGPWRQKVADFTKTLK